MLCTLNVKFFITYLCFILLMHSYASFHLFSSMNKPAGTVKAICTKIFQFNTRIEYSSVDKNENEFHSDEMGGFSKRSFFHRTSSIFLAFLCFPFEWCTYRNDILRGSLQRSTIRELKKG